MMDGRVFVDTNVLLRAKVVEMDGHAACSALLKRAWEEGTELWISGQVMREFFVQLTHPKTLRVPLTLSQAIESFQISAPLFRMAEETSAVHTQLIHLLRAYSIAGKQIHDANIVATMQVYDIRTLFTLNTTDFQRFHDAIQIISPV